MEINLGKVSFVKSHDIATTIILILSPFLVFLITYDYAIIEKLDVWKILIMALGIGGFLYVIDIAIATIFVGIVEKLGAGDSKNGTGPEDLDMGVYLGIFIYSFANLITIGNLIWIKFYEVEDKKYWIKASIETHLLGQSIAILVLVSVVITAYLLNKDAWKRRRALSKLPVIKPATPQ